jgi:hypothetical protein
MHQHFQLGLRRCPRFIALGWHHGGLIPASHGSQMGKTVQAGKTGSSDA